MNNEKIDESIGHINNVLNELENTYDIYCGLDNQDDIILNKIALLKDRCINLVMYLENSKFKSD